MVPNLTGEEYRFLNKSREEYPRKAEKKGKPVTIAHAPPPNRQFPISTHQAEIDPQVNITRHSCCSLPALATYWHVGVGCACHYIAKIYPQGRFYPQKSTCTAIPPPKKIEYFLHRCAYRPPQQTNYPSNCAWPSITRWPASPVSASL